MISIGRRLLSRRSHFVHICSLCFSLISCSAGLTSKQRLLLEVEYARLVADMNDNQVGLQQQ